MCMSPRLKILELYQVNPEQLALDDELKEVLREAESLTVTVIEAKDTASLGMVSYLLSLAG